MLIDNFSFLIWGFLVSSPGSFLFNKEDAVIVALDLHRKGLNLGKVKLREIVDCKPGWYYLRESLRTDPAGHFENPDCPVCAWVHRADIRALKLASLLRS